MHIGARHKSAYLHGSGQALVLSEHEVQIAVEEQKQGNQLLGQMEVGQGVQEIVHPAGAQQRGAG